MLPHQTIFDRDGNIESDKNIIVVKVGGSSITDKAMFETLNERALQWLALTISESINKRFTCHKDHTKNSAEQPSFVLVHGAGSFGHMTAKKFGLRGMDKPPRNNEGTNQSENKNLIHGLVKTRQSVKKLNDLLVSELVNYGLNAVSVSPCINIPGLHAHGGDECGGVTILVNSIKEALMAGLVPVIHGDAGLYGISGAGILSGDTLVKIISSHDIMKHSILKVIFLTDVDGVYNVDPKTHNNASLVRHINPLTLDKTLKISASESSHKHDVTGGLKTKLQCALIIATCGIEVVITKCSSRSAEQAIEGVEMDFGTVLRV